MFTQKIWIRGAGDLATGIAIRLYRCGFRPVLADIAVPTTVRRTVAFSPAIYMGSARVEDIEAILCKDLEKVKETIGKNQVPIMEDTDADWMRIYQPDIVIDAIIAKRNVGTRIDDARLVIGVGPGFIAREDCHAVVETNRGHNLGRVLYEGGAEPNTGVPGNIGGFTKERIIRANADGMFKGSVSIGDFVHKGDIVGISADIPIYAQIDGIVRGLLQDGVYVKKGMKSGDIDPRAKEWHCHTVSDKATAIGGGVVEAILSWLSTQE